MFLSAAFFCFQSGLIRKAWGGQVEREAPAEGLLLDYTIDVVVLCGTAYSLAVPTTVASRNPRSSPLQARCRVAGEDGARELWAEE